jgi:arylsulfatase A-like enzyme
MALSLLDHAVQSVYNAVDEKEALDNTYFIFASDNGGCPTSGGRNYPLRGGKSTLFEGGTRVEAFLYSKKLSVSAKGSSHSGLFHVTDWFPTILEMARITYEPVLPLDGFSQVNSLLSGEESPREYVLYNFYTNIEGKMSDFFNNAGGAIRDSKYKLLHTYTNSNEDWFTNDYQFTDDSIVTEESTTFTPSYDIFCSAPTATTFEVSIDRF